MFASMLCFILLNYIRSLKHKIYNILYLLQLEIMFSVCRYIGEIISDCEADTREDDSYLFDLDNRVSVSMHKKNVRYVTCYVSCALCHKTKIRSITPDDCAIGW